MRKLAAASLGFSTAVFVSNYLFEDAQLLYPALAFAVLALALSGFQRKRLGSAILALLFFSLGLAEFYFVKTQRISKAEAHSGKSEYVEARLLDYPQSYSGYCRAEAELYFEDGFCCRGLVYDCSMSAADAAPGDILYCEAKIRTADTLFGEEYDSYYAKGIFLRAAAVGTPEIIPGSFALRTIPVRIRNFLLNRVSEVFEPDIEPFMRALLLGEKSELYGSKALIASMSGAGFMHTIAVSGMHIAFLVGFLQLILGRKPLSSLICIALVWMFVLVTGAGPAAVRAGIMQSFILFAPLVGRENDPVTSLSAALAAILLLNPFAARSVSLQLSFGSMAGIVMFADRLYKPLTENIPQEMRSSRTVRYIASGVSTSVAVMVFTLPLTALLFGKIPLYSLLSNLLGLWAVSLCFCIGWLCCAPVYVPFVSKLAVPVCTLLAKYILTAAEFVSSLPHSLLYMQTAGAWPWLAAVYLLFALAFVTKGKKFIKYLGAGSISLVLLAGILYGARSFYRTHDTISVIDVGQGQCISAFSASACVMIDCGNISNLNDAGELAAAYLGSCGRDRVDTLLLTHLHEDHAGGVEMLLELADVGRIVIPENSDKSSEEYHKLKACAAAHGVELIESAGGEMREGNIVLRLYQPELTRDENERCLMLTLSIGEYDVLITADAPMKAEREFVENFPLHGIETLIVGHHGSRCSNSEELLRAAAAELAVISVGYNNYGHPAEETLEGLREQGYNIFRTDLDGTIEIQIGQSYGKV